METFAQTLHHRHAQFALAGHDLTDATRSAQKRHKISSQRAEDLPQAKSEEIARMCMRIYRVLRLTGYARMDLRLAPDGTVYALEANPNPAVQADEDLALSAKAEGVAYPELLQRIVNLGLNYRAAWDTESD